MCNAKGAIYREHYKITVKIQLFTLLSDKSLDSFEIMIAITWAIIYNMNLAKQNAHFSRTKFSRNGKILHIASFCYFKTILIWFLISINPESFHESLQDNIPLEPIYTKESTSPNHKTGLTIKKTDPTTEVSDKGDGVPSQNRILRSNFRYKKKILIFN